MSLRDRILTHLQHPDYRPSDEVALARALGLAKKQRAVLTHEVRRMLSGGELVRVQGDRLRLAGSDGEIEGRIHFRQGGYASVNPTLGPSTEPAAEPIQISPEDSNVALPGDRVVVRVYARRLPPRDGRGAQLAGRVVRVVERSRTSFVGTLRRAGRGFQFLPDDPRVPVQVTLRAVETPEPLDPPLTVGDKVVVQLDEWLDRDSPLTGVLVQRLGRQYEPRAELLGVYEKFSLSPDFPTEVLQEAAALPARVRPSELVNRLDYRETPTITIDPDDAKDFDDALSIETLDGGEVRVGVHIADVSAYVASGTALDREAQRRGNSTYLVGTVVPMLPEKLSNGLCSLVEGQDRLTKAVLLTFDRTGRLRETTFANTVIRSRKRLTYRQAYALLFEGDLNRIRALPLPAKHQTGSTGRALNSLDDLELVDLQSWVRKLWAIAKRMRTDRMAAGSLDLDMPETKIFVNAEGYADRLEKIENDESHQLIEEFMLAANEAVARLTRSHRMPSIYRVHDAPDDDRLAEFRQYVATFNLSCGDLTRREEIGKLLRALTTHPQGYLLRSQLLRHLKKACYRATPDGHYGLSKKDYTHFTSPIRRYSDLVVHRVFDCYLVKHAGQPTSSRPRFAYTTAQLDALGEHLSATETNSQEAERESQKIKLLEYFEREMSKRQKTKFAAVITDVRANGLFIELTESLTFGFVPIDALPGDTYRRDAAGTALIGRRGKHRYALGSSLEVVVASVDRYRRMLDFRPVGHS